VVLCATGNMPGGPIGAAVTHQVSSFLVMLNSLRLLRVVRSAEPRWQRWIAASPLPRWLERAREIEYAAAWRWVADHRRELARPAVFAAAALILLSGVYTIRPDEVGVIERFGRKILPNREPGLHYKLPWPIERLTKIQARRIRVVEIGFRSSSAQPDIEPAAYEWNVQHRSGRFQRKPEESLMLTGDQNMIELSATVHYNLARADDFIFRQFDGETTIRAAAESVIQSIATTTPLDDVLTIGRKKIEDRARSELQKRLDRYGAGIEVLRVKLQDVHPSLEVVDAFRDVSGAYEEKNRLINEAEGYRNEQIALARGNALARLKGAAAYTLGRKNRADGDATRFIRSEQAYRGAPGPTETRLYLETMEEVLPGKKKMIVDPGKARRHLMLIDEGVEITPPAIPPVLTAPPRPREESE
ncbi:MAG: FtsH protease activity modulator HflK, partial [Bryobacteraceae bacterium]